MASTRVMTVTLAKSAQKVQDALTAKGMGDMVVKEFPESTRTADDAARAIGCDVGAIVKSLMFRTKAQQEPVLVLASGANRVNEKTIKGEVGEAIEKADAEYTRKVTGFAIGGIPPVGHDTTIVKTYIDEDLLKHTLLWAAAGTPNAVFSLPSKDLPTLTGGKVMSIK